ncbi:hypothetical protein BUALT_Bualt01G0127300 [Buddleja alternifolia]|uniref:DUF547 domain-containing protein n=1 Tax=Buddleja alternifolia TaxID=168488 RepID=A0AAV6Y851_9LAMI|nr:hypothetical protein BUALT_Bualt01G0127300 [Buddleja alternifolia]
MKFEELLMQPGDQQKQTKLELQEEVEELERELNGEVEVNRVLQCAMQGPHGCCPSCSSLSPFLPFKVQMLLAEVAVVEEEIDWLERKINELKLDIYQEKKQIKESEVLQLGLQTQWDQRQIKKLPSRRPNDDETLSISHDHKYRKYRNARERRASLGSSIELQTLTSLGKNETEEVSGNPRCSKSRVAHNRLDIETEIANPNKLSIELMKCLIGIFLNLNQATFKNKGSTNLSKHSLTCMNSKGLVSKATFSCKTAVFPFNNNAFQLDPYGIFPEPDFTIRDVGPYKNFIQITRSTVDANRLSECLPAMRRLRVLMQKLSKINITYFNHKQKLAFWINVYNASVMHAFLQHGLPSSEEKLLALENEAAINVGGVILKASTIEHFILRHPAAIKHELRNEKEMFLSQACGLGYPEPNIVFALCRGSWSSPAIRVYTADEVMNELEKAKVEYLEASVGITSRKKILVPKLMHRQMKDFADDMDSLLEWIYSQLPYTSSLKRLIMECLNGETQSPSQKMIEIQPYASEFRYLIPV